jgi:hypothetical protein
MRHTPEKSLLIDVAILESTQAQEVEACNKEMHSGKPALNSKTPAFVIANE